MSKEGRTRQVEADAVDELRGPGPGVFGVEDRHLDWRRPPTAVLGRPVEANPTLGGQAALPLPSPLDLVVEGREGGDFAEVVGQPAADLGREGLLVGGE